MATLNTAFNIASGALDADQGALNVVANNVANANTTGYTRELPSWQTADSVTINGVAYGDGVDMTGPVSQRAPVLQQSLDQQNQAESASAARLSALEQVQGIFSSSTAAGSNTATAGLSEDLSSFFDSLSALEVSPGETSLRQQVLASAGNVASDFNSAASQLESQQSSVDAQSASLVSQINGLTATIATLNVQIESTSPNGDAGTLEDARDSAIEQLGALVGVNQIATQNNGLTLTTASGALLVSGGQSFNLSSGDVNGVTHFFDAAGNDITSELATGGGELGGLLTVRDQDIPQIESAFDTLAYDLGTAVNTQNESGVDANGNPGVAIFSLPPSATGAASQISVSLTDPSLVAAAAAGEGSQGGSNATAMAALANQAIVSGETPAGYYSDLLTSLGSLVSQVQTQNTNQQSSMTQLQNQIGSVSGVSLNDEAASLDTYEQAYQAASKVFTILSNVMNAALNLGVETTYS